ncbi:[FeFe] hydrogenase H-cluster maturation GTPase HydF [Clostridiaceae bacterium NSJ-31]|uniref:[FeFe] hydrogenase H-cluster maturation GTPase HydF n=2 Tax=Ligaoa zhengdingensis TaxID=2763658 RepID=A0A926I354_9FIRM|nr:[FeFe] hydrogenase H-cluster maturation GTPase HydF [Ligaoa zhengdingensis]MBC8546004.1 [FeFe] hydrogenase H-cluster maturation GTPase HydF [Ligaoa zhengdingensis]
MSLTNTPSANRLHIGIYGRRNSGKSSLINALTGQETALVSDYAGTTTDPVYKAMELHPIGPVMFIDTAGFDDEGELGALRVQRTQETLRKADLALMVFSPDGDFSQEAGWLRELREQNVPVVGVISQADRIPNVIALCEAVQKEFSLSPIVVSAKTREGIPALREAIARAVPEGFEAASITQSLVREGDIVLLVMPQDIQAPKGRLILPQVQTIRDLLDRRCTVVSVTADRLEPALRALKAPPALIITDSQCFEMVHRVKPDETPLTSFSVLFAAYKGDIRAYVEGAAAIDQLTAQSRVLIAEACTHAPLQEDIGRVKIPRALRKRFGESLRVDICAGVDFPVDLTPYDLVIHCGGCMFNRRYVLSRIRQAQAQGVPMTNYGVALAKLTGILDQIVLP